MASENKLQDIIQTSMENLRTLVDANTIIGTPIATDVGTTIIPVSKVSVGLATGGLDFNGKNPAPTKQNFGGGGGSGLTIQPIGFLVVKGDGSVEMINVGQTNSSALDQVADVIERTPEIFGKIKAFFGKKKKKKKNADASSDEETDDDNKDDESMEIHIEK